MPEQPINISTEATIRLSKELRAIAGRLEADINKAAGERTAFALVVFTPGRASYISNGPRDQVVNELEGLLEFWRAGGPDIPAHKIG